MGPIKFIPKACQDEKPTFSGYLELVCPTFDQRYEYIEAADFRFTDSGEVEKNYKQMGSLRKLVSLSAKHYSKVELIKLSTGEKIESFEAMTMDPDCDVILIEVAMQMTAGFKVSKN